MTTTAATTTSPRRSMTGLLGATVTSLLAIGLTAGLAATAVPAAAALSGTAAPVSARGDWSALAAKATRGNVPVIVELAVANAAAQLTSGDARSESAARASVVAARANLSSKLPARTARRLAPVGELPLVSLHASAAELATLRTTPGVASVVEDRSHGVGDLPSLSTAKAVTGVSPATAGPAATPASAGQARPSSASPTGTSPRGAGTDQLPQWWDYYRIGTDMARNLGWTGRGQTVAVLDTGVEASHSWLRGDVVWEACFSTGAQGYTGGCPNGTATQSGAGSGRPCTYSTACAHGTHVAHTAAGANGIGSGASIVAMQVFHYDPATRSPRTWDSDYIRALDYVYRLRGHYRFAAVNMSLGGGRHTGYCDSAQSWVTYWINTLKNVGIATVISSGNENYANALGAPACNSRAVSVGNTTLDNNNYDAVLGYTRYGSNSNATLDLLAPGTDICSAQSS